MNTTDNGTRRIGTEGMGRQEAPAGLTSQAHSPIGDHSPDEGHQH